MPSVQAYAKTHGLRIGRVNVNLNHFGYDGDQSHKHPRNLPLLLAKHDSADWPTDGRRDSLS
jgi:hypothetical protein